MPTKRYSTEQIVSKLRQAEVELSRGLRVPASRPTTGSCVRCRPAYRLHVWAYDFLTARTHDGRPLKILTVVGHCQLNESGPE